MKQFDNYLGTQFGKHSGRLFANTSVSSSDDHNLSLQIFRIVFKLFSLKPYESQRVGKQFYITLEEETKIDSCFV